MTDEYWPAPAKINLFLHITGRRDDGYHTLQTVFQFLDLHDRLYVDVGERPGLTIQRSYSGFDESDDLVLQAARTLQQATGVSTGATIRVEKILPIGGGLGGGSSNAATTLHALNHLWGTGLAVDELAQIGLTLGADVPVFVRGTAAWAEGVGEILEPVDVPETAYLVIWPGSAVNTARVFNDPDLTRNSPAITIRDFLSGKGHNDCEAVVRKAYPEIDKALNWLGQRADARLTGTGGCIFAACKSVEEAQRILGEIPEQWTGYSCSGINHSPLLDKLH